jgi:hypothetical protein
MFQSTPATGRHSIKIKRNEEKKQHRVIQEDLPTLPGAEQEKRLDSRLKKP